MKRSEFINPKVVETIERKPVVEKSVSKKPVQVSADNLSSNTAVLMMEEAKRIAEEKRQAQMKKDLEDLFTTIEFYAKKGEDSYMPTSTSNSKDAKIAHAIVENKEYLKSLGYEIWGNKFMLFFGMDPIISWTKKKEKK